MAMLDSLFGKAFKASKCKTLLKLTIPRIKLLRNRRDNQIKQMRREISKLLETGQEATARIRVEHIIREEKMVAAQEIVELFSELIAARLPIIEAQRECPLDLKEAISSVCFAAPRCTDLPELQEAQILFAAKYGKEFVSAATELRPECGVNRQLVELLSVRAPAPDVKMKLLKEIAEEHELDWDPSASESELLKPHEDLLNGPTQTVSMTQVFFPKEEHDETKPTTSKPPAHELHSDFDEEDYEIIDFPEVPSDPLLQSNNKGRPSAPEMLPFPMSALSDDDDDDEDEENQNLSHSEPENVENKKQFVPFIYPPSSKDSPPSNDDLDLQDVLAAAQTAAEAAECAAAAARSAASIAQLRINELVKNDNNNNNNVGDDDDVSDSCDENPFHLQKPKSDSFVEKAELESRDSFGDSDSPFPFSSRNNYMTHEPTVKSSYDDSERGLNFDSSPRSNNDVYSHIGFGFHQPQRLQSMDDNAYFSKPSYDDAERDFDFGSSPKSSNDVYSHVGFHQPQRSQSMDDNAYFSKPTYDDAERMFDFDSSHKSSNDVYSHVGFHQPQRLQSMDDIADFSYPDLFTSQRPNLSSQAKSFTDS